MNFFANQIKEADKAAKEGKKVPEIRVTPTYTNTKPKEFSNVYINNTHTQIRDENPEEIQPIIKRKFITVKIPSVIVENKGE